jgi:hypothetical protein
MPPKPPIERLTPNFYLHELTASQAAERFGLDNTPGPAVLENLRILAARLEQVRAALGHPRILVSSGYRSPAVNARVGGSKASAHLKGLAADFIAPDFGTPLQVCHALVHPRVSLVFDQLIYEGTWVHLGLPAPGKPARQQVLTAHFRKGRSTRYTPGLPA